MIVSYSSSSSEEESSPKDDSLHLKKRQKLDTETRDPFKDESGRRMEDKSPRLPLPETIKGMFRELEEKWTDNCEEHGGRMRSFQHERGNWATHLFIPYEPNEAFMEVLNDIMELAQAQGIPLTISEEFHLSLSKTVILRHHWIQPFVQSLRTGLTQFPKFFCTGDKLSVYCNAEKTRTFLGAKISTGTPHLLELIKIVDHSMVEFNLSTFYKDPSFHISFAWCVGDHSEKLEKICSSELQGVIDTHEEGPFLMRLNCRELRCKSGNKVFVLPLQ
ncbi:hypothetical protein DNTS_023529 [Danionella cerebrum]|uniref:U6 snRNA phosphodiesterase n=1 Tax=Danionella cerebrum TaxID=2873325 RepID=A0A553R7D0_9TELE|nr:hypothetical protein DNTS_023529 [Danionella translucida]